MLFAKQSTAATVDIGPALDSAGAEYTGLVIGDLTISKNGTRAAMASAATLTHATNGIYTLVMTTGNTDTLGRLQITCNKSTYQVPQMQITVLTAKVFDSIVAGSDNLEVDAIQLLGTAILTPATAGTLDVNTKLLGGATVNATTSVTIPGSSTLATTGGAVASVTGSVGSVTGLTAANLDTTVSSRMATYAQPTGFLAATFPVTVASTSNITSVAGCAVTSIATDAISAASLSAAGVTKIQSGLATPTNITAITGNITGNLSGSVGSVTSAVTVGTISPNVITASALATDAVNEIVDQVWDELLSGHTTSGSTGAGLSAAGAAGDPWSTALPGSYGAGTAGKIVGDNLNATISSRASQTSLDTLDDLVDTEVAAIKTKTDQLTFTVANQIDANSLTIGANAITASALATDAVNEIQSGLATPTNITAATGIVLSGVTHTGARIPNVTLTDTATNLTNAATSGDLTATMKSSVTTAVPTVSQTADQVWDELLSGHAVSGSTGAGLSAAGAAGDPWSTLIPASYGAGTAGKILGDNVNATISSRASQTSLDTLDDYVDTEVAAIKTQTDKLTFTVANQVDANSLTNGGLSASATRSAIGLASANLDTQIGTLATPTNITAGTITTVTNLTNAPTSGDLTATMKSSVTAAVPTAAQNFAAVLTTALTESYAADGSAPTLAQAILLIQQSLHEFAINSTTRTVKKLDGSTTAATFTLDSATAPTSTTRAT